MIVIFFLLIIEALVIHGHYIFAVFYFTSMIYPLFIEVKFTIRDIRALWFRRKAKLSDDDENIDTLINKIQYSKEFSDSAKQLLNTDIEYWRHRDNQYLKISYQGKVVRIYRKIVMSKSKTEYYLHEDDPGLFNQINFNLKLYL